QTMAERYGVSVPQLCIRYTLQLDTVSLPKTANPDHMRSNAQVDFEISDDAMVTLRDLEDVDYVEHSAFPVYSAVHPDPSVLATIDIQVAGFVLHGILTGSP